MKQGLSIIAAAIAATGVAHAQFHKKTGPYIGGGIGAFQLADDTATTPGGAELTNDVGPRVAFSVYAGKAVSEVLLLEGQIGFWSAQWDGFEDAPVTFTCPAADPDDCLDPLIRTASVTANAILTAPLDSKVRPYIGGGAGFFSTDLNLDDVDASYGFGYLAKAGVDFEVSTGLRLGFEGVYVGAPEAEFDNFVDMEVAGFAGLLTLTGQF
ncbi:MAG: outer membrane beta-barrel protein [Pseudomonadota bacterium]